MQNQTPQAETRTNQTKNETAQPQTKTAQAQTDVTQTHVLRVCSDPNNSPFSNQKLQGFETKIADLIAREFKAKVEYFWWAQRRGFFRNTLDARRCDLVMGAPENFNQALTTEPYYRSTYAFVSRKDRHLNLHSLDDPALRALKIGVHTSSEDYAPPAQALARRQIISNVVPYLYDDYAEENPPAKLVEAVAKGDVDVAIVWGPLAGYFAKRLRAPLEVAPAAPQMDAMNIPLAFNISMAVRKDDGKFRDELNRIIRERRAEIEKILDGYGAPQIRQEEISRK